MADDKYCWTLMREPEWTSAMFEHWALGPLASATHQLIPSASDVRVTLQDPDAQLNATVAIEGADRG